MRNSLEQNPDFIESRYNAGTNQYDLEILAAAPELVAFGGGAGEGTSDLSTNSVLIATNTRGIGGVGCPALDQFVLARGGGGEIELKLAGLLTTEDHLFNPLTGNFNRVKWTRLIYQPTARIIGRVGETICSWTHPLITNYEGVKKRVEDCDWQEEVMVCDNFGNDLHRTVVRKIKYAGIRATIEISLESEFIYASSHRPPAGVVNYEYFFLANNLKSPDDPT